MNANDVLKPPPLILLTGAPGYIGGRLRERLGAEGHHIRCLARRPEFLRLAGATATEVVQGDVRDLDSLLAALQGVHTAYYLIHSMGSTGAFEEEDRQAAQNFAEAARRAGVKLIGSGSLSFEMICALVERLPMMITPWWVSRLAQPIAIDDLLAYLLAALELPGAEHRIFEIGGADQVSYGDLMREYARQRGLPRVMIPVPVLTPRLSSVWLGLVTPLYARVGRKIVDSMRHPTIVHDTTALRTFPIRPIGMRDAIARALRNEDHEFAQTRWSDALSASGAVQSWAGVRFGSRLADSRSVQVPVPPAEAFLPIRRIGGTTGWYYGDWLWRWCQTWTARSRAVRGGRHR